MAKRPAVRCTAKRTSGEAGAPPKEAAAGVNQSSQLRDPRCADSAASAIDELRSDSPGAGREIG